MLKHGIMGIALITVLVLAAPASSQTMPSGKWWKDPNIAEQLNLTAEDVRRLDQQFVHSRRRMIELKNRVEREQFEYQTLIESKTLDEKAVNRQLQKLEKARSELNEERAHFVVEIRKILGPERFQKLQRIYSRAQ